MANPSPTNDSNYYHNSLFLLLSLYHNALAIISTVTTFMQLFLTTFYLLCYYARIVSPIHQYKKDPCECLYIFVKNKGSRSAPSPIKEREGSRSATSYLSCYHAGAGRHATGISSFSARSTPRFGNTKKTHANAWIFFVLVEMRGVEPLSERLPITVSTRIVFVFDFI